MHMQGKDQAHDQGEDESIHSDASVAANNPYSPPRSTRLKSKMSRIGDCAVSAKSTSTKTSRASAALAAKTAALMVEAAPMEEKEQLEQHMLRLKQQVKRLKIKTELEEEQSWKYRQAGSRAKSIGGRRSLSREWGLMTDNYAR